MSIFFSLVYFIPLIFILIGIDLFEDRLQNQIDTLRNYIVDIRLEQLKDKERIEELWKK